MKAIRNVLFSMLALFATSPLFAQGGSSEKLTTVAQASAIVGLAPGSVLERLVPLNMVNVTARHCQAYKRGFSKIVHWKSDYDFKKCNADPSTVYFEQTGHNLRTTAGGDWQASVMGNTSAPPATMNYIAVTNDSGAPAAGDTTLASEITTNGLARAQCAYAHTAGTAAFTCQKVFTATGTQASQKTGLFNASSAGTMGFENTYTAVTVNNGDTLTVTWTVNY